MSDNFVGNVLALLRLIKNTPGLTIQHSAMDYIQKWSDLPINDQACMRLAAYISEQAQGAESLIAGSRLNAEAKDGLLATTAALRNAFSLPTIQQALSAHLPALDASLSGFAILASATQSENLCHDCESATLIIDDIENIITKMKETDIDPIVSDTIIRHMTLMKTLLLHVGVFGADAAISAYMELLVRFRRLESVASPESKTQIKTIWTKIEKWSGRLASLDKAINSGTSILSHFEGSQNLLEYLPGN